ncbi:MAG: hypothetical protein UHM08_09185 [Bacteroidales bacterium]|jgi:hypothetical protein|nr:hypothetical protein [Bacteroidales bacterium]
MKKRVAYIEIDGKRFGDKESGLDISFDVSYNGTNLVPNNSTFTITNVNSEDLAQIVTNTSVFLERKRTIKCFAGYSDNIKNIFSGQILQASPTNMPDTIINISAQSDIEMMGKAVDKSYKNPRFITLIEDAAEFCGLRTNIPADIRTVLQKNAGQDWSFTGSAWGFLQRVEQDLAIYSNTKDALAFPIKDGVLYVYWQDKPYPANIPVINKNTGLIGIPTPTRTGVNFQVLLDVSLQPLQTVYLQSERLSLYNGLYNIINIRHNGSLRGRDWYTNLECIRVV